MLDNNRWWFIIPIMPCSKAMSSTFTNMEHVEDNHGKGGEDNNNASEEVDHEARDTYAHEDVSTIGDVDFP